MDPRNPREAARRLREANKALQIAQYEAVVAIAYFVRDTLQSALANKGRIDVSVARRMIRELDETLAELDYAKQSKA